MDCRAGAGDPPRRRRCRLNHRPQYDHADLSLVDNDLTEDMRKPPSYRPDEAIGVHGIDFSRKEILLSRREGAQQ